MTITAAGNAIKALNENGDRRVVAGAFAALFVDCEVPAALSVTSSAAYKKTIHLKYMCHATTGYVFTSRTAEARRSTVVPPLLLSDLPAVSSPPFDFLCNKCKC